MARPSCEGHREAQRGDLLHQDDLQRAVVEQQPAGEHRVERTRRDRTHRETDPDRVAGRAGRYRTSSTPINAMATAIMVAAAMRSRRTSTASSMMRTGSVAHRSTDRLAVIVTRPSSPSA